MFHSVDKDYPQKTRHNLFVFRIVPGIMFGESLEAVSRDAPQSRIGCTGKLFRDIRNSLLQSSISIKS